MGAVRTLLAIAAIVTHTGPLFPCVTMISGNLAIQAFFGSILVSIVLLVATHPIEQSRARDSLKSKRQRWLTPLPSISEASPLPVVAVCAKVQPRKNPN